MTQGNLHSSAINLRPRKMTEQSFAIVLEITTIAWRHSHTNPNSKYILVLSQIYRENPTVFRQEL